MSVQLPAQMNRIVVIGTTGSGKTAFAIHLAAILNAPHVELDELAWEPGWHEVSTERFLAKVEARTTDACWIVDGDYWPSVGPFVWSRADTVIWLNYSFLLVLSRLLRRTLRHLLTGEQHCNGNRETWRRVLSPDSIIRWAWQTHWRRLREYPQRLSEAPYRHLQLIRLRAPREAELFLEQLRQSPLLVQPEVGKGEPRTDTNLHK